MKYNIAFILFLCVCSIAGNLSAQITYKLSVDELLEKGIQNSLSLQSAYQQKQIATNNIALAKNKQIADIQLSGQLGFVGNPIILDKDLSFYKKSQNPDWKQYYQVNAVQPLYQGGRITNNIEKAKLQEIIAQLSFEQNKSDLKLWLIQYYLNLYNLYKQEEIYQINIEEASKRLQNIRKMREEGMITSNDVLRSQLLLTNYQLSYNETVNNLTVLSQQIAIALGMDENLIFEPDSIFLTTQMQIKSLDTYIQNAYNNYPQMKMSNTYISVAKTDLKIVKADYLPAISLQAGNIFQRPIPNTSPSQDMYLNTWGITLSLSYRISALFDRKHTLSTANTQIKLQELAQEKLKQDIRIRIKTAYLKHLEALDRVKALETSVQQAIENYRIMNTKYFNQLAILTDLLDANSIQLSAELQLIEAKTNALYTYYQLLNISGTI